MPEARHGGDPGAVYGSGGRFLLEVRWIAFRDAAFDPPKIPVPERSSANGTGDPDGYVRISPQGKRMNRQGSPASAGGAWGGRTRRPSVAAKRVNSEESCVSAGTAASRPSASTTRWARM